MFVATIAHTFIWALNQNSIDLDMLEVQMVKIFSIHMPISLIVSGFVAFIIYKLMFSRRKRNIFKVCRFEKLSLDKVVVSILAGVTFVSFSSILLFFLNFLLPSALENHQENMQLLESGGLLLFFLSAGIMAPFIEEIMFRGIIFDELERKSSLKLTIIIQGLLFGIYHLNIAQGLYASVMGIVLGLILIWTGSIWAPILVHLGNNLFSIAITLLPENSESVLGLIIIISFIILPLCIFYLYKTRVDFLQRTQEDAAPVSL